LQLVLDFTFAADCLREGRHARQQTGAPTELGAADAAALITTATLLKLPVAGYLCEKSTGGQCAWHWTTWRGEVALMAGPRDRLLSPVYGSLGRMTVVGEVVLTGSETNMRPDR
jgi:hypothetical protein